MVNSAAFELFAGNHLGSPSRVSAYAPQLDAHPGRARPGSPCFLPDWKVFLPTSTSFVPDWKIFRPTGRSFAPDWKVFLPTGTSFVPDWKIFRPTGRSFVPDWKVFLPTGTSLVPDWRILRPTGRSRRNPLKTIDRGPRRTTVATREAIRMPPRRRLSDYRRHQQRDQSCEPPQ